ncbi:hypothetical protein BN8_01165 [Fibrisoma limi BUZ 3]|uniref:Pyrrolo-quinoline quinone n=2 Tax=Fibrisoma limi TaxID=663275 RepID=I2GE65_9BACT|nr:hypothetical protein BN8_01165 [Fibrisoma limi BUZ 3]
MKGYGNTIYIREKYFLDIGAADGVTAYELITGSEISLTDKTGISYQPRSSESVSKTKWVVNVGSDETSETGLFDSTNNRLIWTAKSPYRFIENLLCSRNDESFTLYDINTGQSLWQVDVREIGRYIPPPSLYLPEQAGKIISVLGKYDGIVWLHLESSKLLGIDVATGNVLHQIGPFGPFPELEIEWSIPSTHKCYLDKEQGNIIGMRWKMYWIIDLKKDQPKLEYHWLADELDAYQVYESVPYGGCFSPTHFFFAQYDDKRIAALNRQTLKVDWVHRLEPISGKRSIINRMKYDSDRLFVFETAGLLHIFE